MSARTTQSMSLAAEAPLPWRQPPSVDDVDRIRAIGDPVLRNLEITHAYHRLALALHPHLGTSANWCTFATWASRQAGQTIRGEDLLETLAFHLRLPNQWLHPIHSLWRRLLAAGLYDPGTRLGRIVRAVQGPLDPFERASDAVARGNRKVFEEIGREFARFADLCARVPVADDAAFADFADRLRPGDPPDGQGLLRQAFSRYHRVRAEKDPGRRALAMYLANLEVGWHEQTRLQSEIQEALDAPAIELRELGDRLLRVLHPAASRWRGMIRTSLAIVLGTAAWPVARAARHVARVVITNCLMTLRIPADRVLQLGHALDATFAEPLRCLIDEEATTLVSRFRCDALGAHDCGAHDWAALDERMHYIAHLFRAFHDDAALASPPFSDAQLAAMMSGRIPDGTL